MASPVLTNRETEYAMSKVNRAVFSNLDKVGLLSAQI